MDSADTVKILRITSLDEAAAWVWMLKDWSKLSFTDCTCFAFMKRCDISQVVSFDKHFKRAGFVLIE